MFGNNNKEDSFEARKQIVETFCDIVYMEDGVETTSETYDDFDDARADYLYMIQQEPERYEYAKLRQVTTNFCDYEDIQIVDEWERK